MFAPAAIDVEVEAGRMRRRWSSPGGRVAFAHVGSAMTRGGRSSTTSPSPSSPGPHRRHRRPTGRQIDDLGLCSALRHRRGRIAIDGQDNPRRDPGQPARRHRHRPAGHVLFNDTIYYTSPMAGPRPAARIRPPLATRPHSTIFVLALPDGYQTPVGERGLKLSGGEKHASPSPAPSSRTRDPAVRRGDLAARYPHREGDPEEPARGLANHTR